MAVELNHTIVLVKDKDASATFMADLLGLPKPKEMGPFAVLQLANDVSILFMDFRGEGDIVPGHCAFLISDEEFDQIFGRIREGGIEHWADCYHREPGRINDRDGGRGVYFEDPSGHNMEIMTRPYGSGGA
uniref:ChaP n=1 Tax=Streptomyces chartreusis TaxID=1969 RepID=UPI0024B877B8|nr:Chain A, ChaP [Streptomyces chartreusis]7WCC_B Chain B, ChaP [Streptomyces chartreusis]7WCC_C Chain C, ChaP [Streptomyces chartreusis]7WCC_D Chain D, ChaP [Streptomyces chartreusis]